MGETKISWTDRVWQPMTGCTPCSPGCAHCYAKRMSKRLAGRFGYPADEPFRVTLHPERLSEPLGWAKPSRVFVSSMGDLFHEHVPLAYLAEVMGRIEDTPQHTYQLLTKRAKRLLTFVEFMQAGIGKAYRFPDNCWVGVTAEDQQRADERIPLLLQVPAAVRWVSYEPALGPLRIYSEWVGGKGCLACDCPGCMSTVCKPGQKGIGWLVAGAESGPGHRPMQESWVRNLRDQCVAANVPLFYKQAFVGSKLVHTPELDGRTWQEFPNA